MSPAEISRAAWLELSKQDAEWRAVLAVRSTTLDPAYEAAYAKAGRLIKAMVKALHLKEGERWSRVWGVVGFVNQNTRIPEKDAERLLLLGHIASFLETNPDWENIGFGLTAAAATTASGELSSSIAALAANEQAQKQLQAACGRLVSKLRRRLRALLNELQGALAKDDPRWGELGVVTPAAHLAAKPSRDRKVQEKSQAKTERLIASNRKQAHAAKAVSEKAWLRVEAAEAALAKLKTAAQKSSERAEELFAKVEALESKLKSKVVALPLANRTENGTGSQAPGSILAA